MINVWHVPLALLGGVSNIDDATAGWQALTWSNWLARGGGLMEVRPTGGIMSFTLSKRWIALAVGLLLAAAAGTFAAASLPSASAQEPLEQTFVFSGIPVTASNGFASLGPGTGFDDGVLGAACTGASPLSGSPNVPGQVVTELRGTQTQLRILHTNGATMNGTVLVNCALDFDISGGAGATIERLKQAATFGR